MSEPTIDSETLFRIVLTLTLGAVACVYLMSGCDSKERYWMGYERGLTEKKQ